MMRQESKKDRQPIHATHIQATPTHDPLRHTPSGALRACEPGFEPPSPPGPTSNFVGDAMTGEAVALVAARLAAADVAAAAAAPPRSALAAPPVRVEGGRPPSPPPTWKRDEGFDAAAVRAAVAALMGGGRLAWKEHTGA